MLSILLSLSIAAPPPECPCGPGCACDPCLCQTVQLIQSPGTKPLSHAELYARVEKGFTVIGVVGGGKPGAGQVTVIYPAKPGVYRFYLLRGRPVVEVFVIPKAMPACPGGICPVPSRTSAETKDAAGALAEVNALRVARGLRPYLHDGLLERAAAACAAWRAERRIDGHAPNDFAFVPSGGRATATGCAAWPASMGWGSCCVYDGYTYAGAAWAMGGDGKRYMHLFLR